MLRPALIAALLFAAASARAEDPKLAMTALQCDPAEICSGVGARLRRDLQDQLEAAVLRVVRGHLGIVTPDAVMRELTMGGMSRAEAEQTCIEASCAVDIGGALGAQYIMQSMVYRLGDQYKLTLKVWRVEDNTSAASGSAYANTFAGLGHRFDALARKTCAPLVTRARRRGGDDVVAVADDGDDAPQIDSGDVTDALGGLAAVGKPAAARVHLTGPGGDFNLRIGDTRDGLALGRYRWRAEAAGFAFLEGQVEVTPDGVTPIVVNLPKLASLEIRGEPRGARVDLVSPRGGEKTVGLGSTLRGITPGEYQATVSRGGYETQHHRIRVAPGSREQFKIRLLKLGGLTVRGSPRGAEVNVVAPALNFRHSGGLPWSAKGLKSGRYTVEVQREGYVPARRYVNVEAGDQTELRIELDKAREAPRRRYEDRRRGYGDNRRRRGSNYDPDPSGSDEAEDSKGKEVVHGLLRWTGLGVAVGGLVAAKAAEDSGDGALYATGMVGALAGLWLYYQFGNE